MEPQLIRCAELGFRLIHSQIPVSGAEPKLKQFRGHAQRSPVSCCICSKHGFQNLPPQTPKNRYAHQGKTMLRTYAAVRRAGGSAPSICSKHGFHPPAPVAPGRISANNQKPCLELVPPPGPPAGIRSAELEFPPAQPYIVPNEPEPQLSKYAVSRRIPTILSRAF